MWVIAKYIKYIVLFGLLWVALVTYRTFSCHKMYHDMMQPAIKQEDFKPVYAGVRTMDKINKEDIVVFQYLVSGRQESPFFCGRIVAKEGDRVAIEAGRVKVNGQDQNEAYVPADAFIGTENFVEIIVPRGHYFILGDNRKTSRLKDSRSFGPIPLEAVVGKVGDFW